jgi:enoyl-CoA hydratase/carnithine racemase
MLTNDLILTQDHGPVRRLVMNAPARFNALSDEMLAALNAALDALDDSVRVVVLAGAGKAFCAGHDLRQMQGHRGDADGGAAYFRDLFTRCGTLMQRLTALPQPVVAEVQVVATAAGCQLVASCDLVVAAEGTRFGVNGINIGLFCSTPMVALTRKVAPGLAFEMLATGEFIGADRAMAAGLVNRVAPADALTDTTLALAQVLAAKLPGAMRLGKAGFQAQAGLPLDEAYAQMTDAMVENLGWADTDEGMTAFLEKRPPHWG